MATRCDLMDFLITRSSRLKDDLLEQQGRYRIDVTFATEGIELRPLPIYDGAKLMTDGPTNDVIAIPAGKLLDVRGLRMQMVYEIDCHSGGFEGEGPPPKWFRGVDPSALARALWSVRVVAKGIHLRDPDGVDAEALGVVLGRIVSIWVHPRKCVEIKVNADSPYILSVGPKHSTKTPCA